MAILSICLRAAAHVGYLERLEKSGILKTVMQELGKVEKVREIMLLPTVYCIVQWTQNEQFHST